MASSTTARKIGYIIPSSGIASDTGGNVSETRLRNTVSERRIVTSVSKKYIEMTFNIICDTRVYQCLTFLGELQLMSFEHCDG